MKISFVIPAYNEEEILARCLTSVMKEIERQRGVETEIIVVNNASTDRTNEVASAFQNVRIIEESRKGLVWARRAGFLASSGEVVANIDADTMLPEGWLTKVINEFTTDRALLALSGPQRYYDAPLYMRAATSVWYLIGFIFDYINEVCFKKGAMLQGGNFVLRREAMERIGGFDTSIEFYGEDTDIGRKVRRIGKVKWTFAFPIYASGRRLKKNGLLKMGFLYGSTFISIIVRGKPCIQQYEDVRNKKAE